MGLTDHQEEILSQESDEQEEKTVEELQAAIEEYNFFRELFERPDFKAYQLRIKQRLEDYWVEYIQTELEGTGQEEFVSLAKLRARAVEAECIHAIPGLLKENAETATATLIEIRKRSSKGESNG